MSKKPFSASTIYMILGLVFIALISIRTISTPEIWTHLAQGKANAPISYLESDRAVNTTLLYDKAVYGLWDMGGAPTLIIVNTLCLLAAFMLLVKVSGKWGGGLSQGFALLLCGHLIFQSVDVGPQSIMMLFIALFIFVISTQKRPGLIFGILIPLQILWANMHGSFLFGPLIAVLAAVQAWQNAKGANRKKQQTVSSGMLGILTIALLVATLANPYLAKLYGQVVANIMHPSPLYWSSLLGEYFRIPSPKPLIFFVLILGAGGLITLKKHLPIMLTTLAVIGAFLAWIMPHTVQLFTVLSFPFMVLSFTAVGEALQGSFKPLMGKQSKLLAPVTQSILALLIVISAIFVVNNCAYAKIGSASSFGFGTQEELYPNELEALLNDEAFPDDKKTINFAADGGYLAFKYDRKIFIDYRSGRYEKELLNNLTQMLRGNAAAYDRINDTYRPEAIIINTLPASSDQGLVSLLARGIWKLAYFDGTTAVLLLGDNPLLGNTKEQAAGLTKLEAARAEYAKKIGKGCRHGNAAELIGAGKVFLALNRPVQSKAIFSLLLQGNAAVPSAWIGLGNSQLRLKEFDAATTSLKKATELAPNNLYLWVNYAKACQLAAGRLKESDERTALLQESEKAVEKANAIAESNRAKAEEEEPDPQPEPEIEPPVNPLQDAEIPE